MAWSNRDSAILPMTNDALEQYPSSRRGHLCLRDKAVVLGWCVGHR
jgi:hypothetical protein